jgi:MFS family permease
LPVLLLGEPIMIIDERSAPAKAPRTFHFLILLFPFGVCGGYASITLAFLLGAHGVSAGAVGALIALSVLPQTWKVLWAPVVDSTLSAKAWYGIGALLVGLTLIAMSLLPHSPAALGLLSALVLVSSAASTFISMASEVFLAGLEPGLHGRASGWTQAGNLGGSGLGGGLALVLAERVHPAWVSGAALGLLCVACAAALPLFSESPRTHVHPTLRATLFEVCRDVWSLARSRDGLLVILLMLLPLGSGGAGVVLNAVAAREWHVSADLAAGVGGLGTGLIAIPAALIGGLLCDVMDRRLCYCLLGCAVVPVLTTAVFLPRTPLCWTAISLAYAAVGAACFGAFMAVVLEVIGEGAAATKFNLMASISNVTPALMPVVEGFLHDRGGSNLMFWGESALSLAAALLYSFVVWATRRRRPVDAALEGLGASA